MQPHNNRQVQSIATDFSHLKMLGHVFVVDDAKDLAQIVRDATRYGGSYRPEVSRVIVGNFLGLIVYLLGCVRIHSATVRLEED